MNHKIRLGPIAVFLTVIAAVLATLAILTVATSRADAVLAERFAQVTQIRYDLEKDGNRFLQALDSALMEDDPAGDTGERENSGGFSEALLGRLPEGTELTEEGLLRYYLEKDGYSLTLLVSAGSAEGHSAELYEVTEWKIRKLWEEEDPFEDLWLG